MQSQLGEQTWFMHNEWGVKIAESQSEITPLQRNFLVLAHQEYGATESDIPSV